MAEDLAKSAMYAVQALVDGLRDAGKLPVEAIERRIETQLNAAGAIESAGVGFEPGEPAAIRHGMWWLRECIAPTGSYLPGPVVKHPRYFQDWPKLGEPWPEDIE